MFQEMQEPISAATVVIFQDSFYDSFTMHQVLIQSFSLVVLVDIFGVCSQEETENHKAQINYRLTAA
jgi:hypothetical protein